MHLNLPRQEVRRDRYVAEPMPGFGVCIYTVGHESGLYCQSFAAFGTDLEGNYIAHITRLARGDADTPLQEKTMRMMYPFLYAPDVLTMKCLIEEACNNWMDLLCSRKQS